MKPGASQSHHGTKCLSGPESPSPETVISAAETSDLETAARFSGTARGEMTDQLAFGLAPPGTFTEQRSLL